MPVDPASFGSAAIITARALNTALYTYSPGNNHAPTGILFHAMPPMLTEVARAAFGFAQSSSPTGASSETPLVGSGYWQNSCDTSAVFSIGADLAGAEAYGAFTAAVPGSSGSASTGIGGSAAAAGGWHLFWGFPMWAKQTNTGAAGALIQGVTGGTATGGNITFGGFQRSSTSFNNASYVLDLLNSTEGTVSSGWALAGICADASSNTFAYATSSALAGTASRLGALWACGNSGSLPVIGTLPVIQSAWAGTTPVTSSVLNNSITSTLQFLNLQPSFRVATAVSPSILAGSTTAITLGTAQLDTHSGWNSVAATYTVPVTGVYLVHGCLSVVNFSGTGNSIYAGVRVGTVNTYGPAYTQAGGSASVLRAQITRLLDLQAGDAVQLTALATANAGLSNSEPTRFLMKWMAALAGSSNSAAWTVPDLWYRWQAGAPGSSLPSLFTQYVGNDLNFLINRPYFLGYQSTAQSGLSAATWYTVQMGSAAGIIHASAGDNYGGWVSGTANRYAAQVPGWYLATLMVSQASPNANATHAAGISYYTSGTIAQSTTPDMFQVITSDTATAIPGAEAIGLYYLDAGDYLQPEINQLGGNATYSTSVSAGHQSTFGVVWVSE
jgi:hypothetical protein